MARPPESWEPAVGVNAKPQSVRLANATKRQQRLPWSKLSESTKPDGTITQKPSDANAIAESQTMRPPSDDRLEKRHVKV